MRHSKIIWIFTLLFVSLESQAGNYSIVQRQTRALLYPSLSDLQITVCTVSNAYSHNHGRGAANMGFQFNYRLPWRLQDFYRPIFWARTINDIVTNRISSASGSEQFGKYNSIAREITGGQLYKLLEQVLLAMGFHADCLIKSVCELAHTPFDNVEEHFFPDLIHFLLTPSVHQSFHPKEQKLRNRYQAAENAGRIQADCDRIYYKCPESTLSLFTVNVGPQ